MTEKVLNYDRAIAPQETGFWCGPAATQMILNSRGIVRNETDLARELGTTTNGTDFVGLIEQVLNRYLPGGRYQSVYIENDPPSIEQREVLWRDIVRSINAGYGVAINIVAPPSNYPRGVKDSPNPAYKGGTIYHYVAALGYDNDPDLRAVWIADSGFRPYGYWVSLNQLATLVPPKGYASANVEPSIEEMLKVPTNQEKLDRIHFELTNLWTSRSPFRALGEGPVDTLVGMVLNTDGMVHLEIIEKLAVTYHDPETLERLHEIANADPQQYPDRQADAVLAKRVLSKVIL